MSKTLNRDMSAAKTPTLSARQATAQEAVREQVGMSRWLRLTARKTASAPKAAAQSGNPASDAAANALAELLRDAKKRA